MRALLQQDNEPSRKRPFSPLSKVLFLLLFTPVLLLGGWTTPTSQQPQKGSWTYGRNLRVFNLATDGLESPVSNAFLGLFAREHTFTGAMAKKYGFTNASVLNTTGTPGDYTKVLVHFTK